MLAGLPRVTNENVLVGFETSDDAGVYKLSDTCALVQTVDFFTPIVDDPYTFGAIAAVNSLSDVYAMGGKPITALSILAYPGKGDLDDLAAILRGGADKLAEAGCPLIGGHSVNDDEIKFGFSITGIIHPQRIKANSTVHPGDALVLTKPIGTGVISTALKRDIADPDHVVAATQSMLTLNKYACEAMLEGEVHGCTDVTGFGLIGHAREMAIGSNTTLQIHAEDVPLLAGALEYASRGAVPGGLNNNREFASSCVSITGTIAPPLESLLYDPQTAGGLLIALPVLDADALVNRLPGAVRIGSAVERRDKPIQIL